MKKTYTGWTNDGGLALPTLQVFYILGEPQLVTLRNAAIKYFNTSWRQMKFNKLKKYFRGLLRERTSHTLSCITNNRSVLVVCVGGGRSWHLSSFYCWCSGCDVTGCGDLVSWQNLWYGLLGRKYQMLFLLTLCFTEPTRKGKSVNSLGWFIFIFMGILPLLIVICFKLVLLRRWKLISEVRHWNSKLWTLSTYFSNHPLTLTSPNPRVWEKERNLFSSIMLQQFCSPQIVTSVKYFNYINWVMSLDIKFS